MQKARGLLWRSGLAESAAGNGFSYGHSATGSREAIQPLFLLAQIGATPRALAALERARQTPAKFLGAIVVAIGEHRTLTISPRTNSA